MTTKEVIEDNPIANNPPPALAENNILTNNIGQNESQNILFNNSHLPSLHPLDQPFQGGNLQIPNTEYNSNNILQSDQNYISKPQLQPQQGYPQMMDNYQQPQQGYPQMMDNYQQPQQGYPQMMDNYQQPQYPPYQVPQVNQQMNVYNQQNFTFQQNQPFINNKDIKNNDINSILEKAVSANVEQKFELLEAITNCETQNEYYVTVKDKQGNKTLLFKAKEKSTCCCRVCCAGSCREFDLNLKLVTISPQGQQVKKDYIRFSRPFKCTFCCCGRPEMKGVYVDDKKQLGKIREPCRLCSPKVNIFNKDGKVIYTIVINCCQMGFYCRNSMCGRCSPCKFEIYKGSDTDGKANGIVNKKVKGLKSLIGDADFYEIVFPSEASVEDKILMIGAVIMIDYLYYEDKDDDKKDNNHHRRTYVI